MSNAKFFGKTLVDWLESHQSVPVIVHESASISELATALLAMKKRDAYVIDKNNRVIGHIGFVKVANQLLSEHRSTHTHRQLFARVIEPTAKEVMDPHFTSAYKDELLCDVIHRQLDHGIDDLIVLTPDTHEAIGVIQMNDILAESL